MLPGDKLHSVLQGIGYEIEPGCQCLDHLEEMNRRGKQWCRDNISTIVGWLESEYHRRHGQSDTFPYKMAESIVRFAIWRSKDA